MATIGANMLTLSDWAKRVDPEGKIPVIAELLEQTNDILNDMIWIEGNLPAGHQSTVRTGLPDVFWRLLNQGVQPSKSETAQIKDSTGMLEAYSELDVDVAKLNGNDPEFRLSEASPFLDAMSQEMAQTVFYGNVNSDPEEFNGLSVRYADLSADNAQNIVTAGGSGSDNSSIWLVVWSPNTVFGVFPKGSQAGLMHEDLGVVTVQGANGIATSRLRAYQDHWQWKAGLVVKDWRYAVRIANIDISDLPGGSAADLTERMIRAYHRIPNLRAGTPVFYMNRTVFQYLDIQRRTDVQTGGQLNYADVDGRIVPMFRGIPIRLVDQLLETEATVA
jgi:hypothetical protein